MTFRKIRSLTLTIMLFLVVFSSCTTERDGFMYRNFHNMTARYNGFFYATESMREADLILKEGFVEDYDKILPIFIYGTEETSEQVFPQMERVIEKTTNVIDRHTMNPPKRASKSMKRPEKNKWIDNNWLLMGQAYFYKRNYFKAEEIFRYVTRRFKDPNIQVEAYTWLSKVYIEKERWIKANNNLVKAASSKKEVDEEVQVQVFLVYADYYLRQGDLKEAANKLEKAIIRIKKKKDKARPTFILAQIKQELGKSRSAIELYEQVVILKPEYEMEFYAKINQALAFSRRGGDASEIEEMLLKMIKDDKNQEYQDQIYYALADLAFDERDRSQGIDLLLKSIEVNTDNTKQNAKSFLRLADVHFESREYELAQEYYASALINLSEDHDRYKEVKNLAESLTELVTNLDIINEEDSLLRFCSLDEGDLEYELKKIQRKMERKMEEQREADELALMNVEETGPENGVQSMFWVYNNSLRASGYSYFKEYWGDRELEDDWRRKNKISNNFSDEQEDQEEQDVAVQADTEENKDDPYYVPSIEELMEGLPCGNEERLASSHDRVTEAFYQAGVVYKEKLDDFDNAVEKWEVLTTEYDDSDFHPTAYYQLYRSYLAKEQEGNFFCADPSCTSEFWAKKISEKYPGSEWDKLIQNPDYKDYKDIKEAEERLAYEQIYEEYHFKQYLDIIQKCNEVIENEPDNHLICKYRVMRARCVGHMDGFTGQRENYIAELKSVIEKCPGTEEASESQEILDLLEKKPEEVDSQDDDNTEEEIYVYNTESKHYLAVIFEISKGNANQIKASVADFNTKMFKSSGLKTTSNLLGKDRQVVLVKTFDDIFDARAYFEIFTSNTNQLSNINSAGHDVVLISKENYLTLFKTKALEEYKTFFTENYQF